MTNTNHQIHALLVVAVMVFGIFAGTMALAGTATATGEDITSISSGEDATTGSVNGITQIRIDLAGDTGAVDDANITLPFSALENVGVETGNVTTGDVTVSDVTDASVADTDAVVTNSGDAVNVTVTNSGSSTFNLDIVIANLSFPSDVQDSTATTTVTLTDIESSGDDDVGESVTNSVDTQIDNVGPGIDDATAFVNADAGGSQVVTGFSDNEKQDVVVEVLFDEAIESSDPSADAFGISLSDGTAVTPNGIEDNFDTDRQVFLEIDADDIDSVTDVAQVNVTTDGAFKDNDGNNVVATDNQAISVSETASTVLQPGVTGGLAFQGETVGFVNTSSLNDDITISTPINTIFGPGSLGTDSSTFYFETANRITGIPHTFETGGPTASFSVRSLDFRASVDSLNIDDTETLTGEISANTANRAVDVRLTDSTGSPVDVTTITLDSTGEATFDFGTQNADTYSIVATDVETGISTSTFDVTVTETATGEATLADDSSVVTTDRGDVAEFTVDLSGEVPGDVTLIIGDEPDTGYQANVSIRDSSGDGEVTVRFNTYAAGSTENGTIVANPVDSDDTVRFDPTSDQTTGLDLLETGDYDLLTSTGNVSETLDNPGSVGTLVVEERSTNDQLIWTAESGLIDDIEAASEDPAQVDELETAIEDGELTQSETVAEGDAVVHLVDASGLTGLLESNSSDGVTGLFGDGEGIVNGDSSLDLRVRQTDASTAPNEVLKTIHSEILDNGTFVYDQDDSRLFIVYRLADTSASVEEAYDSRFRVNDQRLLDPAPTELEQLTATEQRDTIYQSTVDSFEVRERSLEFDADPISVSAVADQSLSGTTTVAPGTEFDVRVRSRGNTSPAFSKTAEDVTVRDDGSFSANFDFSGQNPSDEFTATVRRLEAGQPDVDGTVEAADPAVFEVSELTPMDITETFNTAIDVSATVTNTGGAEATQTVTFQISDATLVEQDITLAAGASRSVTFESIPTDVLEPGEYEHGVFTDDDSQTATLIIETTDSDADAETDTDTETGSETEIGTETETQTATPTPTENGVPGFGAVVTLIALVAAAMLATRRKAE